MTCRARSARWTAATLVGAAMALAEPASAQASGSGFLFREPRASLSLRAGFAQASARSDLFAFTTDTLTLSRGDFAGMAMAAEVSLGHPGSRLDVVMGIGYSSSSAPSEFRNWVDQDDQPIEQTTTFRRVPVSAGIKAYLAPRGRALGRYAWVPARVAPYVGAGIGAVWYSFRQQGDFVDFRTFDVFTSEFKTSGWGPLGQGMAGLDIAVSPRVTLTADARYAYAKADVGGDFDGFERIDLSGLTTTVGFNFRY